MAKPHPWTRLSPADADLLDVLHMTRFELALLRKTLLEGYLAMNPSIRLTLSEGGTNHRLLFLTGLLKKAWERTPSRWLRWLRHISHTETALNDIFDGCYAPGPPLIHAYSDLFGITPAFLLIGSVPEPVPEGPQTQPYRIGGKGNGP